MEQGSALHLNFDTLRSAIEEKPDDINLWRFLAWVALPANCIAEAVALAESYIEMNPELHIAVAGLAEELANQEPGSSKRILDQILRIEPDSNKYQNLYGSIARKLGNTDAAIDAHRK